MNPRTLVPLLRSTAHAITWRPLVVGAVLGPAILLVPEALTAKLTVTHLTTLARIAAICVALGAAFLLDDPATRSTPAVPTPRLARNLVRVTLAGPAVALWWTLTLGLAKTTGHHAAAADLPVAALTLEAATLLAAALALAAIAQRRTADGNAGVIAAPAVLLLAAVAWFLPHPVALILTPTDPHWAASHHRWIAVLATALAAFLWASHDRERWRLTGIAALVLLVGAGTAFAFRGDSAQPSGGSDTGTPAWKQVAPGGDCQCADGSRFSFWARKADPTRVVLFLNGGGVCWNATATNDEMPRGLARPGVAHLGDLGVQRREIPRRLAVDLLAHRRESEFRADLLPVLEQHLVEQQFPDVLVGRPQLVDGRLVSLDPLVQVGALVIGHGSRLGGNESSSC